MMYLIVRGLLLTVNEQAPLCGLWSKKYYARWVPGAAERR